MPGLPAGPTTVVGRVEQNETRHNDPNHAVERDAKKRAPHGVDGPRFARPITPGERPSLICREARQIKPARDGHDPCGVSRSSGALKRPAKGSMTAREIHRHIQKLADPDKAKILQGFFKTGPGEYGEGDRFLGIVVPVIRKLVTQYQDTPISEVMKLLKSVIHEERFLAVLMLVQRYEKGDDGLKKKTFDLYLKNIRFINNWDLVDLSAPNIVGSYLTGRSRKPLYALARSRDLWKRRIAIISTFAFIRRNEFADTLRISGMLLADKHDLIHKAVGWMLREVGKRDLSTEEGFLQRHYRSMPRTMLRYAIERFPESKRQKYLNGKV